MNDRIRVLRELAADYASQTYSKYTMATFDTNKSIETLFEEKFAELIVKECIKEIGYKSVELLDIDFYPHYQERLKNYFGVEE
jgi:hypothetical protein